MRRIGIIGAGAWGTALAQVLRGAGHDVALWARESAVVVAVNRDHENKLFLPGVALDPAIRAAPDAADVARGAEILLLAVPAQHLRAACHAVGRVAVPAVICAKGIETGTGALMSEIVAAEWPGTPVAVLSGPTFAAEVARGLPTAVTLAARDPALSKMLADELGTRAFRPYVSDDVVGAEIGGAVKNVLAIACGIVEGRRLGDNARAALITRGLAEMVRLAVAKRGRAETLMGLSGLGDLVLTCTDNQSRNRRYGLQLGQGKTPEQALASIEGVVEGVRAAPEVLRLAARYKVELPLLEMAGAVIAGKVTPVEALKRLAERPLRAEAG